MFLTRMAINPARRQSRFLLGSPQALHAAVLAGFPPGTPTGTVTGRVLWRVDEERDHVIWLYVVSPDKPDLTHLVEQAGWPTQAAWETRDYASFLGRIKAGQRWAFRLTANPVRTVTSEDGISKRLGHVTAAQQRDWLLERAGSNGFRVTETVNGVPDVVVSNRVKRAFRRGEKRVTLSTARFDGQLEVTSADALRLLLSNGLGRAKGYGCGLLTLAPLQR